jgi:hypothetical protein
MDYFAGLDISMDETHVCVLDREGVVVRESKTESAAEANHRQVAAYAGLAPTPWQSGSVNRVQGISQSGNPRLRTTMIQLAWLWIRHQPGSALTLWFQDRIERNGGHAQLSRTLVRKRNDRSTRSTICAAAWIVSGCCVKPGRGDIYPAISRATSS